MENYEYTPLDAPERHHLYKRLILRGLLFVIGILFVIFGLPHILPPLAPFVIAFLVAVALNPLVNRLEQKTHINRRVSAFVLTFFVVGVLFVIFGWLIKAVVVETMSLASNIDVIWGHIVNAINFMGDKIDWIAEVLPGNGDTLFDSLTNNIYSWLQSASKSLINSTLALASNATSKISNIVIAFTITLLAIYFTISDFPKLIEFVNKHTERQILQVIQKVKNAFQSALGGYLKSQIILALLAFVVMFSALALYGQKYSLLIAIGLAIVDLVPIIGMIAVLIPWAIIESLAGETGKALFLLILAIGFFILRKIVEPKIVGSQTGLHPLVALACIYAGMKIAGVWGAILGPVLLMVAVNIYHSGIFTGTIADLKDLYHFVVFTLQRNQ